MSPVPGMNVEHLGVRSVPLTWLLESLSEGRLFGSLSLIAVTMRKQFGVSNQFGGRLGLLLS